MKLLAILIGIKAAEASARAEPNGEINQNKSKIVNGLFDFIGVKFYFLVGT